MGFETAVHPPGRLIEANDPGYFAALHPSGEGDRQSQPLPLSPGEVAGIPVRGNVEAHRLECRLARSTRKFIPDPLPDQKITGVLC